MYKNQKGFIPIIIILVVLIGFAGFYFLRSQKPETVVDSTKDWKDYTNASLGLSFKYPEEYKFEELTLDSPNVKWMGNISNPKNIVDENTKTWDILDINVAVRGKRGLLLEEWIKDECLNKAKDITDIRIDNKMAKMFTCPLADTDTQKIEWKIVVVENGNYFYTVSNTGYNRDIELNNVFDQILSTFKFTK